MHEFTYCMWPEIFTLPVVVVNTSPVFEDATLSEQVIENPLQRLISLSGLE